MAVPLGLVVCGAPLAARAADVARALTAENWALSIGVTEAAAEWIDPATVAAAAEKSMSVRRRSPGEQRRASRPNRVVAFPLTFNTANKIANGIMDNHVTGTLCDALGTGAPIVATLMVSNRLWTHPAWEGTLAQLQNAGVRFLDPETGMLGSPRPVQSGSGSAIVEGFDPSWVVNAVQSLRPSS
jgi:phosphopantothenoylcysteine synthetase/decarboxylase